MRGVVAQRIVRTIRKPRNDADEATAPKPGGTGLSGRSALSRRSPMGACHGLRVASCISSRKACVAATRDLLRGSIDAAAARALELVRSQMDRRYPGDRGSRHIRAVSDLQRQLAEPQARACDRGTLRAARGRENRAAQTATRAAQA